MHLVLDGFEGWSYKPVHKVRLLGGVPLLQHIGNSTYYFGYEFNSDVSRKTRTECIEWIKGLKEHKPDGHALYTFINQPLKEFNQIYPLIKYDCIVYPVSGRSILMNKYIIDVVSRYLSNSSDRITVRMIKNLPSDIKFNHKSPEAEYADDTNGYMQASNYVRNILMPNVKNSNYFSIASLVKPKYRQYITDFLYFENREDKETFTALQKPKILILDDVLTSGYTVAEMIRKIVEINPGAQISVFTLLGKEIEV